MDIQNIFNSLNALQCHLLTYNIYIFIFQALRQLNGSLGRFYEGLRIELIECLAHVEAILDFSDTEADVGETEITQQGMGHNNVWMV